MIIDIIKLVTALAWVFIGMLAMINCIGGINEDLELIKPKLVRIKIPEKLKYYIPQWCKKGGADPRYKRRKSKVYVLTIILTIFNYIFALLCVIVEVLVFIFVPSKIFYVLYITMGYYVIMTALMLIFNFWSFKKTKGISPEIDKDFKMEGQEKEQQNKIMKN